MIPHMSAGAQSGLSPKPGPRRPKAKPVDPAKKYWWAAAVAVPVLVAIIATIPSLLKKESPSVNISQDSHDLNFQPVTVIEREYQDKNGKALPPDVEQQIEQALQLLKQKRYEDGIPLLQAAAVKAPVPSVLTDLGHALATAGKSNAAQAAYTQAASLDPSNQQVSEGRKFLSKLTENNTILTAAAIPLQKDIAATLLDGDTDFFKFTAPSGPRDILHVHLQNRSTSLGLALAVKDAAKSPIGGINGAAGADVNYELPATPGAIYYLQLSPWYSGGGTYTLRVEPTHSFDAYEPNDTILTARDISVGNAIEANIMDNLDTDFYRFRARGAKTTIVVENKSTTLGIALAVTNSDKAPVGGQNGAVAANVRHQFDSMPGSTYQVQISPYYSGGGKYALTIQ